MAEYTIKESLSEVAEYIGMAVATKENAFRVTEMPEPSISNAGKIYQYIGETDESFTNGYYYECAEDDGTYGWQQIDVQPSRGAGGQTIQYDIMPTASGENEDDIIQYVGATTASYTNGFFYKCVAQGTDPETYTWEAQPVQENGGGADSRIGEEITKIGVRLDDGLRPYMTFDISEVIPEFSQVTPSMLKLIADEYYNGSLSLSDIQNVWSVGDVMEVQVSAMSASDGLSDTHAQQTIGLRILDFLHDDLETSIGTKDKALITLGMVDCLDEKGTMTVSSASAYQKWSITPRRAWCNGTFLNALPSDMQDVIKPVIKGAGGSLSDTITDSVFILTVTELGTTAGSLDKTGTKYAYYDDADSRKKKVNGSYDSYVASNIQYTNGGTYSNGVIDNTGTNMADWQSFKTAYGLSMAFCV